MGDISTNATKSGKLGNATRLDGEAEYIDLDEHSDTCLGSLIHCIHHGLTVSIWVKFRRFETGMYYLSSGDGIKVYIIGLTLTSLTS